MLVEALAAAALVSPVHQLWFRTPGDGVYCGASYDAFTCFRPSNGYRIRMRRLETDMSAQVDARIDPRLRGFRRERIPVLRPGQSRWSSDAAIIACRNRRQGLTCLHSSGFGWWLAPRRGVRIFSLKMSAGAKAATVVVSGLPAPPGVGGVLVQRWNRLQRRPPTAIVFADQEGGAVRAFPSLAPARNASAYRTWREGYDAGRAAGLALEAKRVDVALAPVVDLRGGPLGPRHFRRPSLAVAFARGLMSGGVAPCVKHFPGLGSAPFSTDAHPHVRARITARELKAFRAAIAAGPPCAMTSNAFYGASPFRASISPSTYRLLRRFGYRGVAITDSLSIVRRAPVERWSRQAVRAGADLLLFTSPAHARRAIGALTPLAARGELDASVRRVLQLRWRAMTIYPVGP